MTRRIMRGVVGAAILVVSAAGMAGPSSSTTYSMDYTAVANGGGIASAASYEMVTKVAEGGACAVSSSSQYTMAPLVGAEPEASAVGDWMLY